MVSNTELSEFFCPHRVPGREPSELLSAYYLCANVNSPRFSQNSPSLLQNSGSSLSLSLSKQYPRNSIPPVYYKFKGRSVRNPLSHSIFWGPPPKAGSGNSPPKVRGHGLTRFIGRSFGHVFRSQSQNVCTPVAVTRWNSKASAFWKTTFSYSGFWKGGSSLLTVGACLLTVELLCLQSVEVLIRRTFPLQARKLK